MNNHFKAFLILVFFGVAALVGAKFILPMLQESKQIDTSDAKDTKGTITIGIDNWAGYIPLCSSEMKGRMRRSGYILNCENDNADYSSRMKSLKKNKIQFAVATVDSYILSAAEHSFPGTIIAVIDESKGGDAIVAWEDQIKTIDDLKSKQDLQIAYTPSSPSEHLIKAIGYHFDVPALMGKHNNWRDQRDGSEESLKALLDKQVDAAVIWEPDVSKALEKKGITKLLGTEDTNKLIVDILLVNREYSNSNPEAVNTLLNNYFKTLKFYRQDKKALIKEIASQSDLSKKKAEKLMQGIAWASLTQNAAQWFGISSSYATDTTEDLVDTIESTIDILIDSGDFSRNPIPDGNPYRITNSSFIAKLFEKNMSAGFGTKDSSSGKSSLEREFAPLSPGQWDQLREIGTLRIRPITFQSGTSDLNLDGKKEIDKAIKQLKHYPNFRVAIKGHTGIRGDKEANKQLSQDRAESVARYIEITYSVDTDRLRAIGHGSNKPLPKKPGESNRAYNYRLPRVELNLVAEEL